MQNSMIQKPKLKNIKQTNKQEIYSENSDTHPEKEKTGREIVLD